jgi:hypothetical protein
MDLSGIPEPLRSKLKDQLDRLPAEVRGKLQSQLAKLPPEQLEAVLAKTSPMLERLAQKQGGKSAGAARTGSAASIAKAASGARAATARATESASRRAHFNDPNYHYNATIGRGDRPMPSLLVIAFVVALVVVLVRGFAAPG